MIPVYQSQGLFGMPWVWVCRFHRSQLSAEPSSQTESLAAASKVKWVIPSHWPLLQILAPHEILSVALFLKLIMIPQKPKSPMTFVKLLFNILSVSVGVMRGNA